MTYLDFSGKYGHSLRWSGQIYNLA